VAAAVGLFYKLGSFALPDLQRMYLGWGVVNSIPSATRDILDHLGKGFSGADMVLLLIPLQGAMVQGGGAENAQITA
jgi:hypothetical protein